MTTQLATLRSSVARLQAIVAPLDDDAIAGPAYTSEWSIAQVVSHIGSAAVILQRRLEDVLAGTETPDDFAPATWDVWDAKDPRAQVTDGLAADAAILARLETVTADEREGFTFSMGPMTFDFDEFVGLRLNEHAFHTWDVEVALDPTATIPQELADSVIDKLGLISRFTAQAVGEPGSITVRTTDPDREFTLVYTADRVELAAATSAATPDLVLPSEAFARLVYGRLDVEHTPPFTGDPAVLDRLRNTFPGA